MNAKPTSVERDHYAKLLGSTIIGIQWEELDARPLPVLVLNNKDRDGNAATVAVLCDPEGNGPGFLEHSL
jgi:hypothetical protein